MPSKVSKPSNGVKGGKLVTSMTDIPQAPPKRPTRQGGDLVGGYPVDMGIKARKGGRPSKPRRKKMY